MLAFETLLPAPRMCTIVGDRRLIDGLMLYVPGPK